ncbi:MAG: PDZ domain-containing protein [Pirellulaceae bacterium]|nr:PDZ domain-containing protein [Pirellulaceae bacterium]
MRLAQIQHSNLKLFDFDYDLTFVVFFLNADQQVYARYGGRDSSGPDTRQSLAGLRHTMQRVLVEHGAREPRFAPRPGGEPLYVSEFTAEGSFGHCIHCHQVKEAQHNRLKLAGQWRVDLAHRFPLPDNLGIGLEVNRGNVVRTVAADSPAAAAGLAAGDELHQLADVPIHSFADAQWALDRAPASGKLAVTWQRGGQRRTSQLELPADWRRTDISWRPSMQKLLASARLFGPDLTPQEKRALGLQPEQLAFRQQQRVPQQAQAAGIRADDIILGFDGEQLEMDAYQFQTHVRQHYVQGESVLVHLLRQGQPLRLRMTFQ